MVHIYFLKKPNRAHWVWECIVVKAYRAAYRKCGCTCRCNCVLTSKSPNAALLYKEFCGLPFNSTSTLVGLSFTLLVSSWFNWVVKFQIQRVKWNSSSAQLKVRDMQKWNACVHVIPYYISPLLQASSSKWLSCSSCCAWDREDCSCCTWACREACVLISWVLSRSIEARLSWRV